MWVAELKSGKKNREILDAMRDFEPSAGWHQLHDKIKEWDDTMFEQAFRILRQQQRMANVNKIINTNIGYDNALKKEVHISEETYFFQSYEDKLITLFERIKSGAKWAIEVIDDCLFIGLYPNLGFAKRLFSGWMHLINNDSPIVNYLSFLYTPLTRPLFSAFLPPEFMRHLAKQEWVMFMSLDVPRLIQSANKKGVKLELAGKKESNRNNDQGDGFTYKNRLIKVATPKGFYYMGGGMYGKILFDFYYPVASLQPLT